MAAGSAEVVVAVAAVAEAEAAVAVAGGNHDYFTVVFRQQLHGGVYDVSL